VDAIIVAMGVPIRRNGEFQPFSRLTKESADAIA
jgi:hypothetical protein